MKTYKQFITEAEIFKNILKTRAKSIAGILGLRNYGLGKTTKAFKRTTETTKILLKHSETLPSGHKVYHYDMGDEMLYHVVNPKSHHISTALITYKHAPNVEAIHRVATTPSMQNSKKRLPLHRLYHHLIVNHDKVLSSDNQSPGGVKVWRKLSRMPGVNIHGWDDEHGIPVNTPKYLSKHNEHETHVANKFPEKHPAEMVRMYSKYSIALKKNKKIKPEHKGDIIHIRMNDYNDARNDDLDYYHRMRKMKLVAHKKD